MCSNQCAECRRAGLWEQPETAGLEGGSGEVRGGDVGGLGSVGGDDLEQACSPSELAVFPLFSFLLSPGKE